MCEYNYNISSVEYYLVSILGFALLIRVVLSFFKVLAMQDSREHLPNPCKPDPYAKYNFCQLFCVIFRGKRNREANPSDYWLGFLIGVAELAAYPVLFQLKLLTVVGGWLALKTAGQWGVWGKSRTAFNRFLFGNLMNVAVSYFWLSRFVKV